MRRRAFLTLTIGVASALKPGFGKGRAPRIGVIGPGSQQANQGHLGAFRDGLRAFGLSDSVNAVILDGWAEGRTERLPGIVRRLLGAGVDILVTAGTQATLAAARTTKAIPVVLVAVGDPLAIGVVDSLDHPGGNVTGLSLTSRALIARRLELLHKLIPGLKRVAVIVRHDPGLEQRLRDILAEADRQGLALAEFEAPTGGAIELVFRHLRSERCDAIYVASGPLGPAKRAKIIALAAEARLPAIYGFRVFAEGGGLISFGADERDLFRRAAGFVDRILGGAKPADLPVELPSKYKLVINRKATRGLGLTIPPALLDRADEVIE